MSVSCARPLVLLALFAVLGLGAVLWRRAGTGRSRRERLGTLLSGAALVLAVLALAGPRVGTGHQRATTFAVDESASVADGQTVARAWTAEAGRDDCVDPCRPVRFATVPDADADADADNAGDGAGGAAALGRAGTDIGAALSTAIGLTPRGGRVIVLSDGGQTQGDLLASAGVARARDIQVDWVPLAGGQDSSTPALRFDPGANDAAITAIRVPSAARVGDSVPLTVTVHSAVAGPAVLSISRNGGARASERIDLRAGDNPLLLEYTAVSPGENAFAATISRYGDPDPVNDSAAAVVDVRPAPRVLVVSSRSGSPVPALLARDRMTVSAIRPAGLPSVAGAYGADAAVVLDDVPATQLSAAQVAALDSAVRARGLGLLVLGGPHSFSEGRYWASPLQQILPVTSLKPGNLRRRNLAVELVLDHSGSMVDLAGGVPKIEMARAGAKQAAGVIAAHSDQLGIIDFDIGGHTLVPLQRLTPGASERRVDAKIATLQASGGTDLYAGLAAGVAQLLTSHAPERHLIMMTDGISGAADYAPLEAILREDHISVATVALGSDADRSRLAKLSRATGGDAYVTDDAKQLPKIFVKETQVSAKPAHVTGRLAVTFSGDSPVVRSLVGRTLPDVAGNVVVTLKRGAEADLRASTPHAQTSPALAQWQIGAGRVVAWTPGLGAPWGETWLAHTALWDDAVRWAQRGVAPAPLAPEPSPTVSGALEVDLADRGMAALAVTSIRGSLTGHDGVDHPVDFTLVGPALYRADVAGLPEGVYAYALTARGDPALRATGEVALAYPAEYSPVTAHVSALGQLVAQTGGQVLAPSDPRVLERRRHALDRLLSLLALIAFGAGVTLRMTAAVKSRTGVRPRTGAR